MPKLAKISATALPYVSPGSAASQCYVIYSPVSIWNSEIKSDFESLGHPATIHATKNRVLQALTSCWYENLVTTGCLYAADAAVRVDIEFHLHGSDEVCNFGHLRVLRWLEIHPLQLWLRRRCALSQQQDCCPENSHLFRNEGAALFLRQRSAHPGRVSRSSRASSFTICPWRMVMTRCPNARASSRSCVTNSAGIRSSAIHIFRS